MRRIPRARQSQDEEASMDGRTQRRRRRTEGQWNEILQRYRASGLSSRDFCKREGLSASSLQRWRARSSRTAAPRFVELTPPAPTESAAPSSWSVELELPGGTRLRLRM